MGTVGVPNAFQYTHRGIKPKNARLLMRWYNPVFWVQTVQLPANGVPKMPTASSAQMRKSPSRITARMPIW
jgi:hypothetical protein